MAIHFAAPAQIVIDPAGTPFTIAKDDQLEDCVVSVDKDVFELRSLASSRPQDVIQTGMNVRLTVVFADMARRLEAMALMFGTTVVTATTKRRVTLADNAGAAIPGKKIVIKPYNGELVSTDANSWITLTNAKLVDTSGSNLAYGLATQQRLSLTFDAFRDGTGNKVVFGDETA